MLCVGLCSAWRTLLNKLDETMFSIEVFIAAVAFAVSVGFAILAAARAAAMP